MKDVTAVLVTTTLISLLPYQGYSFVLPSHSWGTGNQGRSKVLISNSRVYVQNIPFFGDDTQVDDDAVGLDNFAPDSFESLVSRAKVLLATDFGKNDESILSDDEFVYIGPYEVLNKKEFLLAQRFFDLRSTFPDLDYRAHDFRIAAEDKDGLTIRLTTRTVGTMCGDLRLRQEIIPPNGQRMICPPEAISITFDPKSSMKVTKLVSGFAIDDLVGNTNGLCGVKAAAVIAGAPPSDWEVYPPSYIASKMLSRKIEQIDGDGDINGVVPFPESVMIQLARGIFNSQFGTQDPKLLSPSFSYSSPFSIQLKKDAFIKNRLEAFGGDFNKCFSKQSLQLENVRVDPYDSSRVWADLIVIATNTGSFNGQPPTGKLWLSSLEAVSFTFDDKGFCTRVTTGFVMDPTVGNTGGLGGLKGAAYAIGNPELPIFTRSLPEILNRGWKILFEPITGISVDSYSVPTSESNVALPKTPTMPTPPKTPPKAATSKIRKEPSISLKIPSISLNLPEKFVSSSTQTVIRSKKSSGKEQSIESEKAPTFQLDIPSLFDQKKLTSNDEKETKKRSPSLALFGEKGSVEKVSPKVSKSPSFQLNIKPSSKKKTLSTGDKKKFTPKSPSKRKAIAVKDKKKLSIFGREEDVKKTELVKKSNKPKKPPQKIAKKASQVANNKSDFNISNLTVFGQVQSNKLNRSQKKDELKKKNTSRIEKDKPSKSPTLNLFGAGVKSDSSTQQTKAKSPSKSIFGNGMEKNISSKTKTSKVSSKSKKTVNKVVPNSAAVLKKNVDSKKKKQAVKEQIAPRGVPTVKKWRKNFDGSITGLIFGSKSFDEGERITTSPIASSEIGSKAVVETTSGSKYFLD